MNALRSEVQKFLMQSLVPIACSIIVGFFFYQDEVFRRHSTAFQFLWSGVVISVFYYLLTFLRSRDAFLGLGLLLLLTFLTTGSTQLAFILRDILYVGAMGTTVLVYHRFFRRPLHLLYVYPAFMLAGIYGITYIVASQIDIWIMRNFAIEHMGGDNVLAIATTTGFFGLLIGFAVGAGIALNDKLFGMNEDHHLAAA